MKYVDKYFSISEVLKELIEECKPEASVRDICVLGDKRLSEETGKAFKKDKKLTKGIAFPTCLSVNNAICHFSPLMSEQDQVSNTGFLLVDSC